MKLPIRNNVEPLNPAEIVQAKANGYLDKPQALAMLDAYIAKEFPEEKITKLIKELSEAMDTNFSDKAGFWESPNWSARKNSIDYILKLRGFISKDEAPSKTPTKVVFNTVVYSNEKVERGNQSHLPPEKRKYKIKEKINEAS